MRDEQVERLRTGSDETVEVRLDLSAEQRLALAHATEGFIRGSRAHFAVSDIDHEVERARDRLRQSLDWARQQGITARGEVGDPSPTTAIEDELRDFGADEVIVVTHPREHETWQERGELDRLRRELDIPVTHVTASE